MVSLFKDRSPATVVWLFILSIVVHSHFIVEPPHILVLEDDGLISVVLKKYFTGLDPLFLTLIYHALIILQALRLNYLFTDNRMFSRVNYLTAMVFIILTGIFYAWSNLTSALIANIMLIWFYANTIRLYNSPNPKTLIFNIGLIVGMSIILYHPSAILILVAIFALLVVRPFFVAEWLVLLMGVFAPFYFLFSYLYLTDNLTRLRGYIPRWQFNLPDVPPTVLFFITLGVVAVVLFIGIVYWQRENRRLIIQVRKNWVVLHVMLLLMLPLPFISYKAGMDILLTFIVPLSPMMAKAFLAPKRDTLPNILFWCLLALVLVNNWGALFKY